MNFYPAFWKVAKHLDPEKIHRCTLQLLHALPSVAHCFSTLPSQAIQGHHLKWRNSLGIAAGLDKNAHALSFWNKLGMGCVEVGTVTPIAQYGNDRPRIFRLHNQNLINAMGFPNDGAELIYKKIMNFKSQQSSMPIWVNLGKQKDTAIVKASTDYNILIKRFAHITDALVINISSPNTADLRLLQQEAYLENLLGELSQTRDEENRNCPLLLKVSPDEKVEFYQKLPMLLKKYNWQGLIATNTTSQHSHGKGGLSGIDLFPKSFEVAKILAPICENLKLDFVFVGGLSNVEQLQQLKTLPIRFFQIYSAFIYQGPALFTKLLS